jgi:hypothetical protein
VSVMEDRTQPQGSRYGDDCPQCVVGTIGVLKSVVFGKYRHRYLGCRACGFRPQDNKQIVPVEFAPERPKRD